MMTLTKDSSEETFLQADSRGETVEQYLLGELLYLQARVLIMY